MKAVKDVKVIRVGFVCGNSLAAFDASEHAIEVWFRHHPWMELVAIQSTKAPRGHSRRWTVTVTTKRKGV